MHPLNPKVRSSLVAVALLATIGCSAAHRTTVRRDDARWRPSGKIETLADGTRILCRMEKPTGSNLAEPVCRKLDDLNRTRDEYQREHVRPQVTIRRE